MLFILLFIMEQKILFRRVPEACMHAADDARFVPCGMRASTPISWHTTLMARRSHLLALSWHATLMARHSHGTPLSWQATLVARHSMALSWRATLMALQFQWHSHQTLMVLSWQATLMARHSHGTWPAKPTCGTAKHPCYRENHMEPGGSIHEYMYSRPS